MADEPAQRVSAEAIARLRANIAQVDQDAERGFGDHSIMLITGRLSELLEDVDDLRTHSAAQAETIKALEESLADKRRLAREIDVAMHGEEGAAKQASLCDLVNPARMLRERAESAEAREKALRELLQQIDGVAAVTVESMPVMRDALATIRRSIKIRAALASRAKETKFQEPQPEGVGGGVPSTAQGVKLDVATAYWP